MLADLNLEKQTNLKANFVIVGGGTVGLIIAQKIAQ
jgi:L-2-hydroxyglutarate oxidase LhgO